ncbi:hypothetical protein NYP20_16055 [Pseudomonas sp. N3-W]|uniref:hypothetical protein n=1 Tax=Pseudomonas sp. N3-W TaxID=2975049 RepID=UPI00217EB143|nr:hypothetical protein [Pseudomonas sp. N3-W]UWF46863.1 hypothetical protein NYP20_16055 [Pseudomonas sp. N3-W]
MSFGMRIWGSNGALQFNTDTATWRIVVSSVVSFAGAGGKATQQFSVPGCNTSNAVAIVLPIGVASASDRQLEAEMADGIAYVRNFIKGYAGTQCSQSTMRLIVMRWY